MRALFNFLLPRIPYLEMDSFDVTKAPLAFQEWRNTFWFCTMYTNVAWTIVYVGLIQKSMQDRSYAMPLLSQCCNIAWEITFGFICPTDHWLVTFSLSISRRRQQYSGLHYDTLWRERMGLRSACEAQSGDDLRARNWNSDNWTNTNCQTAWTIQSLLYYSHLFAGCSECWIFMSVASTRQYARLLFHTLVCSPLAPAYYIIIVQMVRY